MTDAMIRTFTQSEDPYRIKTKLEQFLKEKNTAALVEVLMDPYEIGTHGAVTKWIMLSSYVKSNPEIQKELFDALIEFDLASLKTFEDIREMLSFSYFSLSEDRKLKETAKYMPPLRDKRLQDFREWKFSNVPLSTQWLILIDSCRAGNCLSEEEVDALTDLKNHKYGNYRTSLMYLVNTRKTLDVIVQQKGDVGKRLTAFVIMHRCDELDIQIDSINYIFEKYDSLLSDENRDSLRKWRAWAEEKTEKKE